MSSEHDDITGEISVGKIKQGLNNSRKVAGGVVAVAALAVGGKYGAGDFIKGAGLGLLHFDYGDNIKDGGVTIATLAAVYAGAVVARGKEGFFGHEVSDHIAVAMIIGAVGMAVAVGGEGITRFEDNYISPEAAAPPNSAPSTTAYSTILDTPPEQTTIAFDHIHTGLITPNGNECEVYFPFNDPDHVAHNVKLVQAALRDQAVLDNKPEFDPGPIDGKQESQTNAAIIAFRTSNTIPVNQEFDLDQCDKLVTLSDANKESPLIPGE